MSILVIAIESDMAAFKGHLLESGEYCAADDPASNVRVCNCHRNEVAIINNYNM